MKTLTQKISEVAEEYNIIYDQSHRPLKIGPDVYLFYAVPKSEECCKNGDCRYLPYYAVGKNSLEILKIDEI